MMQNPVSLFVRLWVEMRIIIVMEKWSRSQPLREAVSWNEHFRRDIRILCRQPLREAVSWNKLRPRVLARVSAVSLFVRLWVEIYSNIICKNMESVSLFVRLWVEICTMISLPVVSRSASSWGCELKFLSKHFYVLWFQSASSWGCELKYNYIDAREIRILSASSWGCELKFLWYNLPWREVLSASSWGCELKYIHIKSVVFTIKVSLFVRLWVEICRAEQQEENWHCQPLREAVSWNNV